MSTHTPPPPRLSAVPHVRKAWALSVRYKKPVRIVLSTKINPTPGSCD